MNPDNTRAFIECWRVAGPELERIRREKLRNLGREECNRQIHALLGLGPHEPRVTTGLIEQQRIFQRACR